MPKMRLKENQKSKESRGKLTPAARRVRGRGRGGLNQPTEGRKEGRESRKRPSSSSDCRSRPLVLVPVGQASGVRRGRPRTLRAWAVGRGRRGFGQLPVGGRLLDSHQLHNHDNQQKSINGKRGCRNARRTLTPRVRPCWVVGGGSR